MIPPPRSSPAAQLPAARRFPRGKPSTRCGCTFRLFLIVLLGYMLVASSMMLIRSSIFVSTPTDSSSQFKPSAWATTKGGLKGYLQELRRKMPENNMRKALEHEQDGSMTNVPERAYPAPGIAHERSVAAISIVRSNVFPHEQVAALRRTARSNVLVVVVLHSEFPKARLDRLRSMYKPDPGVIIALSTSMDGNYGRMANEGVDAVPKAVPYLVFLSGNHLPIGVQIVDGSARALRQDPTAAAAAAASIGATLSVGESFVDDMLDLLLPNSLAAQEGRSALQDVGMVGCSAVVEHTDGDLVIADHGSEIGIGNVAAKLHQFIVRRHAGLSIRDRRFSIAAEPVDFVSAYCMMLPRSAFDDVGGIPVPKYSLSRSAIDRVEFADNDDDAGDHVAAVAYDLLSFRIQVLDRYVSNIKISEVASGSAEHRKAVMRAIATDSAAIQLMETRSGGSWSVSSQVRLPNDLAALERARMRDIVKHETTEKLVELRFVVEEAMQIVQELAMPGKSKVPEESIGWDLGMKFKAKNLGVFVSNSTALLHSEALATSTVADWHHWGELYPTSSIVTGSFEDAWGKKTAALHKALSVTKNRIMVAWYAYCCSCCGFVNEIVSLVASLQKLRDVTLIPGPECFCPATLHTDDMIRRLHSPAKRVHRRDKSDVLVWISHTDPSMYRDKSYMEQDTPDYLVGRSMYEFSKIEPTHANWANKQADEVWVPAEFVRRTYESSGVHNDKLVIIPEAVDTHLFDPETTGKMRLPPKESNHWCNRAPAKDAFVFFADFKWEPRKGWDVLFPAYFSAFTPKDKVVLVVFTHIWFPGGPESYGDPHNITELRRQLNTFMASPAGKANSKHGVPESEDGWPTYCFMSESMPSKKLVTMYNSMDAFVLPTRGEGWGLPAIQAMSMGKPTISTNWGGNTAFMTHDNSFLIPLDGVEEVPPDIPYGWGFAKKWASPSPVALTSIFKFVHKNHAFARKVGRRARKHIEQNFSEDAVAKIIDDRLEVIRQKVIEKRKGGATPGKKPLEGKHG